MKKKITYIALSFMLLLNMFASGYFQMEVKALTNDLSVLNQEALDYTLQKAYETFPELRSMNKLIYVRDSNSFMNSYLNVFFYSSDFIPTFIKDDSTPDFYIFNSKFNLYKATTYLSSATSFKYMSTEYGHNFDNWILKDTLFYGKYIINGVLHDDLISSPIDYSKYYCKYTLVDGTVTDDSLVALRTGGGGKTRGGGAGRYSRAHFPFDPDKVTDIDTKTDDEVKLDVKNKYVRVCYDRVEKKWQPHGRISVVNNTIINNTYITSDDKELDETGEETTPTDPEEPPIEDNWPSDTPSWIKVLADILGGILKGIGEAIGGVAKLIIDGISGLFHTLFVPSENFIGDNFTTLQNNFNEKMPVMKQISETSSSVQNSLFGNTSTEAPNITITLPEEMMLGDITIDAFDFTFFNQYRDMIHSIIIFMMYTPFVLSLPKRIKDALG